MGAVIDENEVARIARLARLNLSDDELRLFAGQLARILDYFKQIQDLDTRGIEPVAHPWPGTSVLRDDVPAAGLSTAQALANAPQTERGHFRVPRVLEQHGGS